MRRFRRRTLIVAASALAGMVVLLAVGARPAPQAPTPSATPQRARSCAADPDWTCRIIRVPERRDAVAGDEADTVPLAYAVHEGIGERSSGERRILLYVTGGPGYSGIDDARYLVDWLDPRVVRAFDLVTFDARGTGRSRHRDCPAASQAMFTSPHVEATLRTFVLSCIDEANAADLDLAQFSTAVTVEDIEAIREALGVERLTMYGSSYGTAVAQAYAAAHPDRLDRLVLDAPIDRAIPPGAFWRDAADGYARTLELTIEACGADPACHAALPDPAATLDRLAAELDRKPMEGRIATPFGGHEDVEVWRRTLDVMSTTSMYSPTQRMALLRAVAAWAAGDRRPFLRMADLYGFIGPGSTFTYFATWCADVRVGPAGPPSLSAYRELAAEAGIDDPAAASVADAVAACVFWPTQPATWAAPPDSPDVPLLVLTATGDPVTRLSGAEAIAERHPGARLVVGLGGGHGSVGDPCAMGIVADFVVDGELPHEERSTCEVPVLDPFVPLAVRPVRTAEDAVLGLVHEIAGTPEVLLWDGHDVAQLGCSSGGVMRLTGDGTWNPRIELDGCAWAPGTEFTGEGTIDLVSLEARLSLEGSRGDLEVDWVGGALRLSGTWDGRPVGD